MIKRVCVFVDGENMRRSICKLFNPSFSPRDYLPKTANWSELFEELARKALTGPCELDLVRTYWYVIRDLDCYPYSLPPAESSKLHALLAQHEPFRKQLQGLSGTALISKAEELRKQLAESTAGMRSRFEGWIKIQDGISGTHDLIEFRRAGAISYNAFTGKLGSEKAVDVKLATDLIVLREIYDTAVIVSGDQDFVPAVQVVKDAGKRVVNVSFKTRSGVLLPGGARRLNQSTDAVIEFGYHDLALRLGLIP